MKKELFRFFKMNDVEYKENILLSSISPIRIGAKATAVTYPDNELKLALLISFLEKSKIKYKIAGRMSNLLPPDEKYEGAVIRTDRLSDYTINSYVLEVFCGMTLPHIARILQNAGLSGFEGLSGIPGSIGGAIVGNAGAFGRQISDLLLDVRVYDRSNGYFYSIKASDLNFGYRSSSIMHSGIVITSAHFNLLQSDPLSIKIEMDRCREIRKNTQPTDKPSLGSCFKRPCEDLAAAWLIDKCGLKGYSIGGAQISEKHAGFIVNNGGSTASDYIALSVYTAKKVYEKFEICLDREVEIM
ncbi:MAG: UDP-N-acetylmuramate dehydrogenase [Clostridia bacterium]|nr:UDP-N-acetylmuramate dehydrogenase [Clostridia bacterium]